VIDGELRHHQRGVSPCPTTAADCYASDKLGKGRRSGRTRVSGMRIKEVRRASRWLIQLAACDGYDVVAPAALYFLPAYVVFSSSAVTIVKLATGTQFSLTTQRIVFDFYFEPIVLVC
jgi:hypothetical protein